MEKTKRVRVVIKNNLKSILVFKKFLSPNQDGFFLFLY
ncbi:hypothetical protein LEP1GSC026_2195 [Leptospira interrogans str. 2002000623]|nr:hypothetical protein LEP1GSC027_0488 [Leptospira interrogans str. 2002000624]EKQ36956.1 hypothetical protein LEP1GSC025_1861 [Leptospira interrogans str. 2002000621]EKQ45440.1 hypothetical protein LEP1GSC026_2195 [Leptospira interrogans str. 2002000623]EKR24994.1 hypothetical protein LEP1GSC087_1342 [Leptospira interrogans serovar Bataviae str. L1111]EMN54634.1 hypothetical protein LEP1GSC089_2072 [Leptospira interrogans serovar Autumnalis str. LP101]